MAYFNTCPKCGRSLDPGEKCDCEYEMMKDEERKRLEQLVATDGKSNQYCFNFSGKMGA